MVKLIKEFLKYKKDKQLLEQKLLLESAIVLDTSKQENFIVPFEEYDSTLEKVRPYFNITIDFKTIDFIISKESEKTGIPVKEMKNKIYDFIYQQLIDKKYKIQSIKYDLKNKVEPIKELENFLTEIKNES